MHEICVWIAIVRQMNNPAGIPRCKNANGNPTTPPPILKLTREREPSKVDRFLDYYTFLFSNSCISGIFAAENVGFDFYSVGRGVSIEKSECWRYSKIFQNLYNFKK